MQCYHDSRDIAYRNPTGAAPCRARIRIRLRIIGDTPDTVQLRTWTDAEHFHDMRCIDKKALLYEVFLTLPEAPCLCWYDFQVWKDGQFIWYGNAQDGLGGVGDRIHGSARSYQITVYDPAFASPGWTEQAVVYQIFPDRFARGEEKRPVSLPAGRTYHKKWDAIPGLVVDRATMDNIGTDFFGGTLRGIMEKLPYIASLGVTVIYLNPIFYASTNHRYDTSDWEKIDPMLGTKADFDALCAAAEKLGIRIVLDGVFSHGGSENPFFQHARTNRDSKYMRWFYFDHWPDQYRSWWGFRTLPEINKDEPDVRRYFLTSKNAIVKRWLRDGASGWRLDVADELPMDYLRTMRRSVREAKRDALLIGEVWEDASNKVAYGQLRSYCLGDTLDSVMNYPLREAALSFLTGDIDAMQFKRRMDSIYENYPGSFARALLNVIGSHDRVRPINVLGGADGLDLPRDERGTLRLTDQQRALGIARLKLMVALVVAMPGMPCVYYGDEAGVQGSADPFNRGTFPWGHEDKKLMAFFATVLRRKRDVQALATGALSIVAESADVLIVERRDGKKVARTRIDRKALTETFGVL